MPDASRLRMPCAFYKGMKHETTDHSSRCQVQRNVASVPGDLQVVGWERNELMAKTDGGQLDITSSGEVSSVACDADLILLCPSRSEF